MTLKIINDIPPSHGWYSACEHIFRPNVYCSACMRVHYLNNVIKRMFFLLFGNTNGAIHAIRWNLSLNKDEWSGKPSCREHFNFLHHDQLHLAIYVLQPKVQNLTPPLPPTETSILQQFPKTLSSLGTMDWHQSLLSIHLLLFHSEDVILKMYFRGELSEAKEEEDRALTSPTKLALWLSCSLLWPA